MEFYEGFAQIRQDIGGILAMSALTAVQLTAFFLIPLCIFYAFGLGKADVLLMICAGAFVLNFTSFIPLPGAAAGAEIGFHTIFSIFFPTHILSVAILFWRLLTFYLRFVWVDALQLQPVFGERIRNKFQLDSKKTSRYNQDSRRTLFS